MKELLLHERKYRKLNKDLVKINANLEQQPQNRNNSISRTRKSTCINKGRADGGGTSSNSAATGYCGAGIWC